jgi:hypothetical protein
VAGEIDDDDLVRLPSGFIADHDKWEVIDPVPFISFTIFLNVLLPAAGYAIAGKYGAVMMVIMMLIIDYVAVCEFLAKQKSSIS